MLQVVPRPRPGIARALVIAGSDKRGAIYGIYDLSEQIGVSPLHWSSALGKKDPGPLIGDTGHCPASDAALP